jgi:NADH:ubiquinone oxidoreductase subunit 4 (subunit M)
VHDVSFTEYVAWVPLLVLIVVLGFFPNIIFHVTEGAVTQTMAAFSGTGG